MEPEVIGKDKAREQERAQHKKREKEEEEDVNGASNPELARERYLRRLLQSQGAGGGEFRVIRKLVSRLDEMKLDLERVLRQEQSCRPVARMRARDMELMLRRLGIGMEQEEYKMLVSVFDHDASGTADLQEMFRSLSLEAWKRREGNEPLLGRTGRLEEADKMYEMQQVQRRILQGKENHVWMLFKKIKRRLEELELKAEKLVMNMDVNKNGVVDYSEFKRGLRHVGVYVAEAEMRCIFDLLDSDKTGELDLFEMCYLFEIKVANAQAFHDMKQKVMRKSQHRSSKTRDDYDDEAPLPNVDIGEIPVSP
mmetsp:Transcript_19888/g.66222  ORF Transcript_19888/g.66222 Transcript_19888/m.66222 type:complete len:310 (+) Transcript_19888:935-1864(+)